MKFNLIIIMLVFLSACGTNNIEKTEVDSERGEEAILLKLSTMIQKHGKESLATLDTLRELKIYYQSHGQYLKSEPVLLDELTVLRAHYNDQHPLVVKTWDEVVELFKKTRSVEEAEALKKALIRLSNE